MRENYHENEYSEMWVENGIFHIVYKPKLVVTKEVAKKILYDRLEISGGVTRPGFADIRNLVSIDREAMKFYKNEESVKFVSAGAFLLDNYLAKMVINIFINLEKPKVPTKFFTDRQKALQWLEYFKHVN